jgi:hypothetical protein
MDGRLILVPIPPQIGKLYRGKNGIDHVGRHIKTWFLHTWEILHMQTYVENHDIFLVEYLSRSDDGVCQRQLVILKMCSIFFPV